MDAQQPEDLTNEDERVEITDLPGRTQPAHPSRLPCLLRMVDNADARPCFLIHNRQETAGFPASDRLLCAVAFAALLACSQKMPLEAGQ